jgi:multicomponent Na+:H+ antiporter subunit F
MTSEIAISATAMFVLLAIAVTMIRLFIGPTLPDRVLAANSIGTKIVMLIALIAFSFEAPANILDIALLYVLLTFTATIAVLKFFREHKND